MINSKVRLCMENKSFEFNLYFFFFLSLGDSTCGQRALYQLGLTGIPMYNVSCTINYLLKQSVFMVYVFLGNAHTVIHLKIWMCSLFVVTDSDAISGRYVRCSNWSVNVILFYLGEQQLFHRFHCIDVGQTACFRR